MDERHQAIRLAVVCLMHQEVKVVLVLIVVGEYQVPVVPGVAAG
jgi:hypothetical protein